MTPYKRLFELVDRSSYLDSEVEEMERVSKKKSKDLYSRFFKAKAVLLPDLIWNKLQNTDSNELEVGDIQRAQEIANGYERDFKHALTSVKNDSYDPPLILQKKNGKFTLVGGNTRLMAAKVLGIRPKVLIVSELNEEEEGYEIDGTFLSASRIQKAYDYLYKNGDIKVISLKSVLPDFYEAQGDESIETEEFKKRTSKVDLDYPIFVLDHNGYKILDGRHRVAKTLGLGRDTIKAYVVKLGKFNRLTEDYFTSDLQQQGATFELFKNPDKGEYNEMKEASYVYLRGVLVGNDAYVSSEHCTDGESPVVHLDILRVLKEKGIINEYSTRFIQDDMIEKYFCFYIEQNDKITVSGSYSNAFMSGTKINLTPYFEKIKKQMDWLNYSSSKSS